MQFPKWISLDLFKQLVRDELSVKYRGNKYRLLLERKEEVSAICWHSLAMEGQLFWSLGGELLPVSLFIWESFTAWKTLTRHCGGRGLLWKAAMLHAWIELFWIWYITPLSLGTPHRFRLNNLGLKSENLREMCIDKQQVGGWSFRSQTKLKIQPGIASGVLVKVYSCCARILSNR